jgi:hypothetical protein
MREILRSNRRASISFCWFEGLRVTVFGGLGTGIGGWVVCLRPE